MKFLWLLMLWCSPVVAAELSEKGERELEAVMFSFGFSEDKDLVLNDSREKVRNSLSEVERIELELGTSQTLVTRLLSLSPIDNARLRNYLPQGRNKTVVSGHCHVTQPINNAGVRKTPRRIVLKNVRAKTLNITMETAELLVADYQSEKREFMVVECPLNKVKVYFK